MIGFPKLICLTKSVHSCIDSDNDSVVLFLLEISGKLPGSAISRIVAESFCAPNGKGSRVIESFHNQHRNKTFWLDDEKNLLLDAAPIECTATWKSIGKVGMQRSCKIFLNTRKKDRNQTFRIFDRDCRRNDNIGQFFRLVNHVRFRQCKSGKSHNSVLNKVILLQKNMSQNDAFANFHKTSIRFM